VYIARDRYSRTTTTRRYRGPQIDGVVLRRGAYPPQRNFEPRSLCRRGRSTIVLITGVRLHRTRRCSGSPFQYGPFVARAPKTSRFPNGWRSTPVIRPSGINMYERAPPIRSDNIYPLRVSHSRTVLTSFLRGHIYINPRRNRKNVRDFERNYYVTDRLCASISGVKGHFRSGNASPLISPNGFAAQLPSDAYRLIERR